MKSCLLKVETGLLFPFQMSFVSPHLVAGQSLQGSSIVAVTAASCPFSSTLGRNQSFTTVSDTSCEFLIDAAFFLVEQEC